MLAFSNSMDLQMALVEKYVSDRRINLREFTRECHLVDRRSFMNFARLPFFGFNWRKIDGFSAKSPEDKNMHKNSRKFNRQFFDFPPD